MWEAWNKLKTAQVLPSDDLALDDSIATWCVDGAVMWFGITIENALNERVNKGTKEKPKWEARYTLTQLLDPVFRLPRLLPEPKQPAQDGFALLLALAGQPNSGVKRYEYVKPI